MLGVPNIDKGVRFYTHDLSSSSLVSEHDARRINLSD